MTALAFTYPETVGIGVLAFAAGCLFAAIVFIILGPHDAST